MDRECGLNMCVLVEEMKDVYRSYKPKYDSDSGFDLCCPEDVVIFPGEVGTLDFKVQCSPNFKHGYYLYARSSISKTPLLMVNSVGIIDSSYRGNIMAKVLNYSDQVYKVNKLDKLFQLCHPSMKPFHVSFVDSVDTTLRGSNGFGSTGC